MSKTMSIKQVLTSVVTEFYVPHSSPVTGTMIGDPIYILNIIVMAPTILHPLKLSPITIQRRYVKGIIRIHGA